MATVNIEGVNPIVIEALPLKIREHYSALEFQLLTDVPSTLDVTLFQNAFSLLNIGHGLFDTVVALVRSVHLLKAAELAYDISYSDPDLPCSIFVSVPAGGRCARLRLAESIIHEAMHLQLTMLEKEVPMVCDTTTTGYSPWQRTVRPVDGLLHGLFVFCVIDQWLQVIMDSYMLSKEEHIYVSKRRFEIANEIKMVSGLNTSSGLTEFGREFVSWLLAARSLKDVILINKI